MIRHSSSTIFACALFLAPGHAAVAQGGAAEVQLLFEHHDTLTVRIEAPLTTLMRNQPEEDYLDGIFTYMETGGGEHALDLKLQSRGRFRRKKDICNFSPIRLNFRKQQVAGTEFAGQDKLKLVTHCQNRKDSYEQYVLREYLAYRILQSLTQRSFGARLMHITYVDTEDNGKSMTKYGFVIEDEDNLEERLGFVRSKLRGIDADELDPEHGNLISVFEYLIGNTDFSLVLGPHNTSCCHNSVLFSENDAAPYFPIPYDFDFSGIVNAPYAEPNPRFELRNVTSRLYRGRCENNNLLDGTFARFLEKQEEIFSLVDGVDGLDNKNRKRVVRFLNFFFEDITSERAKQIDFINKCV